MQPLGLVVQSKNNLKRELKFRRVKCVVGFERGGSPPHYWITVSLWDPLKIYQVPEEYNGHEVKVSLLT